MRPGIAAVWLGAREGLLRALDRRVVAAWSFAGALAVALAVIERRTTPLGAVDRSLATTCTLIVPLAVLATNAAATGQRPLREAVWPVVRWGAPESGAALGFGLGLGAASAAWSAVIVALGLLGHGPRTAAPELAVACGIAALGGLAYAAWFALGSAFGKRGGWRSAPLILDFAFGAAASAVALPFPRAHLRSLLLGLHVADFTARASSLWLAGLAAVLLLATAVRHRG